MSVASYDWSVIGISGNPFPGDPSQLRSAASKYTSVAESVLESAATLRAATDTRETLSAAVAEFTQLAIEVATTMDAIHDRYQTVAEQLTGYAPKVSDAHDHAATLYTSVQSTLSEQQRQRSTLIYIENQLGDPSTAPESLPALERARANTENRLDQIESTLVYYRNQVQERSDTLDAAAAAAAAIIDAIVAYSDLNDGFWDVVWDGAVAVSEWILENAEFISTILDAISLALTLIAFVLVFTGIGAPIAAALFAVARVINIISKVLLVLKVAATIILVIDGKKPMSALVSLGVEIVVDKLVDKAVDGVADKLIPDGLMPSHNMNMDPDGSVVADVSDQLSQGDDLVNIAEQLKIDYTDDAVLDQINKVGFDDYVSGEFVQKVSEDAFKEIPGTPEWAIEQFKSGLGDWVQGGIENAINGEPVGSGAGGGGGGGGGW